MHDIELSIREGTKYNSVNVDPIVDVAVIVRTVQIFGVEKVIKTPFEINFRDAF